MELIKNRVKLKCSEEEYETLKKAFDIFDNLIEIMDDEDLKMLDSKFKTYSFDELVDIACEFEGTLHIFNPKLNTELYKEEK